MAPNELIRQASAKIASYLVLRLTRGDYDPSTTAHVGELIAGWSLSTSEHAEHLLCYELDLILPKSVHRKTLAKSTNAFPAHFASGKYDGFFPEILASYLGFVDWQGEVPATRSVFKPPKNHVEILNILADLGYLNRTEGEVFWTDKAGQAMLCVGAWNPDFQSRDDVNAWQQEKNARKTAAEMSTDLRMLAINNPRTAFLPVFHSLSSGKWYNLPDNFGVERAIETMHSKAKAGK